MTSEVRNRIKLVRKTLNFSQRDFARRVYISQALLGAIELGARNINDRTIQLIVTEFNVNKNWLLTGKGQMFYGAPVDIQLEKMVKIFNQLDKSARDCLLDQSMGLLKMQKKNTKKSPN
jgi:transcriptional regulator with XRE-family HTH domain